VKYEFNFHTEAPSPSDICYKLSSFSVKHTHTRARGRGGGLWRNRNSFSAARI